MKLPEFGFNKEQSFIEFETTEGKAKFGKENGQLFLETGGIKTLLTESDGSVFNIPSVDNVWEGPVDLSRCLTHYTQMSLTSNLEFSALPGYKIGGYAEVALVGDGAGHAPTFDSDFIATPGSTAFDSTLGVINIIGIYYNGYRNYYTITVIV